jgi:hypothetical protein
VPGFSAGGYRFIRRGPVGFLLRLFSVRSVTPSSYWTPSKVLSTGKSPYAFWLGYIRIAPHQHESRTLVWLGPESAQVRVQEVMQPFARCSECLAGLPKWRFKSTVSRSSISSSAFSGSRPQSRPLPPDLRGHGRLNVSIPAISPLPHIPRFLPSSAFRPTCPPLPVHDPSRLFPPTESPFYPPASLVHPSSRILHLSRLALQGPRWTCCLPQPMDGNSYNTSAEEACRKTSQTRPDSMEKLRHVQDGSISGE